MATNDNLWLLCNNITYRIHTTKDFEEMRRIVLELTQLLIPCDYATFFISDGENDMCYPIARGMEEHQDLLDRYSTELYPIDYKRLFFRSAKNKVLRESTLFRNGNREQEEYYQKVYVPLEIDNALIASMSYEGKFCGAISLYRKKGKPDFNEDEFYFLDVIHSHLAFRLYNHIYGKEPFAMPVTDENIGRDNLLKAKYDLTKRETEVLNLILDGASTTEICEKLFISGNTLKKHITNIYSKTEVKNRSELISLFGKQA